MPDDAKMPTTLAPRSLVARLEDFRFENGFQSRTVAVLRFSERASALGPEPPSAKESVRGRG